MEDCRRPKAVSVLCELIYDVVAVEQDAFGE